MGQSHAIPWRSCPQSPLARTGHTGKMRQRGRASYTDQEGNGDELTEAFSTHLLSAKLELVFDPHKFRLGGSKTDDAKGNQKPCGNPANYLSVIVNDFDRVGEVGLILGSS
jgi:hypothetical protein